MGRVIHFEIVADNVAELCDFFRKAGLGWDVTDAKMPGGEYWLAKTGDASKPGIDGAIMPRSYSEKQAVRLTIEVDNIEEAIKNVKAAGGVFKDEAIADIPYVGRWVKFFDPAGTEHGLMQPYPKAA